MTTKIHKHQMFDIPIASSAEVLAGLNADKAITPSGLTSKIVGTVGYSGGIPTGAIMESGSNANGYWVKYADGTLKYYARVIALAENNNSALGTVFTPPYRAHSLNVVVVSTSGGVSSGASAIYNCELTTSNPTQFSVKVVVIKTTDPVVLAAADDTQVNVMAIGRWRA